MHMKETKTDDMFMEDEAAGKYEGEKKIMTMADVAECLQKDFEEEMSDCKKYMCMAKVADNAGDHDASHYLLEMSRDEFTHACFIHGFMENHGMCICKEHEECYKALEAEMAGLF